MNTPRVNIRELKSRLSHYIRTVKQGVAVEVTERGTLVARIVPSALPAGGRMIALLETGSFKWNGRRLKVKAPRQKTKGKKLVADILIEDRR